MEVMPQALTGMFKLGKYATRTIFESQQHICELETRRGELRQVWWIPSD